MRQAVHPQALVQQQRQQSDNDQRQRLYAALADLDERSRIILQARWLGEKKSTLHELADQFGVSAERIRQLEKNAMNKLKVRLAA